MTDTEFWSKAEKCRTVQDYEAAFDVEQLTDSQLDRLEDLITGRSTIITREQYDYIKRVGRPVAG